MTRTHYTTLLFATKPTGGITRFVYVHTGTTTEGGDRQVHKRRSNGQTEKEAGAVLRVRPSVRDRIHRNTRASVPDQVDARKR